MSDYILTLDFGNRLVKSATDASDYSCIHASAKLNASQLKSLQDRNDDEDVYIINKIPYIIGERANRYGGQFAEGANRYTPDYYERFLGVSLWHNYDSRNDVILFAGHATRDINYRDDIKDASIGRINVEHQGEIRRYRIKNTHCWDEPIGGLMNQLLTANGTGFKHNTFKQGEMLVIDIGGLTIDYIISENAKPDYLSARSFSEKNIVDAVDELTRAIQASYPQETKSRNGLQIERVYDAIHTGFFDAGAHGKLDVTTEVDNACEDIVDSIESFYNFYGGAYLHFVLLTGGGAGLLEQRIRNRMMINRKHRTGVHIAHERAYIHMANVYGAHKLAHLYHHAGKL